MYDILGNFSTNQLESCIWGKWYIDELKTYSYDKPGNNITEVSDHGVQGKDKLISTYDKSGNLVEDLLQKWSDGTWVNNQKYSIIYDSSGRPVMSFDGYWSEQKGEWWSHNRKFFTFDNSGNCIKISEEDSSNSGWKNYETSTFTYDNSSISQLELSERLQHNAERRTDNCDTSGKIHTYLYEQFSDGSWNIINKNIYTYDNNGNCIRGETFRAVKGELKPAAGQFSLEYYNEQSIFVPYNSVLDIEYKSIKDVSGK